MRESPPTSLIESHLHLPAMREFMQSGRNLLLRRRTVIASADQVLITSLVNMVGDSGRIEGAATSEREALTCLHNGTADLLLRRSARFRRRPSLVASARHPARAGLLMLIQRPLRSTIEAAIAAGCNGLCSRERVGNGHLLKPCRPSTVTTPHRSGDRRGAASQQAQQGTSPSLSTPEPAGGGVWGICRFHQPGDR